ncbi:MAG: response regulator [Verrucomicrobiota bacterium]
MAKEKCLILDDDERLSRLLVKGLECFGCDALSTVTSDECLGHYSDAMKENQPYDFVILDLALSGERGGKETLDSLLTIDPKARAIATSGYKEKDPMVNYRKYGFKEVLPKPFSIVELLDVVDRVVKGSQ